MHVISPWHFYLVQRFSSKYAKENSGCYQISQYRPETPAQSFNELSPHVYLYLNCNTTNITLTFQTHNYLLCFIYTANSLTLFLCILYFLFSYLKGKYTTHLPTQPRPPDLNSPNPPFQLLTYPWKTGRVCWDVSILWPNSSSLPAAPAQWLLIDLYRAFFKYWRCLGN